MLSECNRLERSSSLARHIVADDDPLCTFGPPVSAGGCAISRGVLEVALDGVRARAGFPPYRDDEIRICVPDDPGACEWGPVEINITTVTVMTLTGVSPPIPILTGDPPNPFELEEAAALCASLPGGLYVFGPQFNVMGCVRCDPGELPVPTVVGSALTIECGACDGGLTPILPGQGLVRCNISDGCSTPPPACAEACPFPSERHADVRAACSSCPGGMAPPSCLGNSHCTFSADIGFDYGCTEGVCRRLLECSGSFDCPAGFLCRDEKGRATDRCVRWADPKCEERSDCDAGFYCDLGRCLSLSCANNDDCGDDARCAGGVCELQVDSRDKFEFATDVDGRCRPIGCDLCFAGSDVATGRAHAYCTDDPVAEPELPGCPALHRCEVAPAAGPVCLPRHLLDDWRVNAVEDAIAVGGAFLPQLPEELRPIVEKLGEVLRTIEEILPMVRLPERVIVAGLPPARLTLDEPFELAHLGFIPGDRPGLPEPMEIPHIGYLELLLLGPESEVGASASCASVSADGPVQLRLLFQPYYDGKGVRACTEVDDCCTEPDCRLRCHDGFCSDHRGSIRWDFVAAELIDPVMPGSPPDVSASCIVVTCSPLTRPLDVSVPMFLAEGLTDFIEGDIEAGLSDGLDILMREPLIGTFLLGRADVFDDSPVVANDLDMALDDGDPPDTFEALYVDPSGTRGAYLFRERKP